MGQKVNPIGLRLGIVKTWDSRWYAEKDYSKYILEDYNIRKFLTHVIFIFPFICQGGRGYELQSAHTKTGTCRILAHRLVRH